MRNSERDRTSRLGFGRRMIAFFGLQRNMSALLGMVVLVGLGEKMAERFLPLYLVALGGGTLSVGLLNGMDNLLSALYSFPGGYLSERLGYKRALVIFNIIALFGFAIVIVFPYWQMVIVGSVFFLSWTAISLPAIMDMVSKALPKNKRTMGVSVHSLVRRIPMALGPVLGGLCIDHFGLTLGVRIAFGVAFALGIVSLVLQQALISDDGTGKRSAEKNPFKQFKLITPDLRNLLISDILIRFCEQIPYAFMAIWAIQTISNPVSSTQFGLLTTIEMVTAMLVYIPVAYLADRSTKKPFVAITFVFFTLFPLMLLLSQSLPMLIVAFVVRGLKEFGEPTRKALIMDLAPEGHKAATFGVYYLIRDVVVSIAAFGGALLWQIDPTVNLLVAFGFGVLGTLVFVFFGRDLGRQPKPVIEA